MGNNNSGAKDLLINTIRKMVAFMNLDCQIEVKEELKEESRALAVSIYTPENARFLIGKNGQNLIAFEHLIRVMFLKNAQEFKNVILDVNDYRRSRSEELVELAKQVVTRVRNTQKAEALLPMSSYERRIVHTELAACPDIATESIGEEPQRRIVIKPYP